MRQSDPQRVFLRVVSPEEAHARWWAALRPRPLAAEEAPLERLRGRVLAAAIAAPVDVPGFDRSNVDGFAVVASDTYGASETAPRRLALGPEVIATGVAPTSELATGEALTIATGGVIPRGADAVVMVEDTDLDPPEAPTHVLVRRPAIPGAMIAFAGSDITRGEVVLRPGLRLGPRETGVIAALGLDRAPVHRRPRVAILSTGDEIVAPGAPRPLGRVHDCNQTMLADTCEELGAEVIRLGIVGDDLAAIEAALRDAIESERADLVLLSGGTSKGAGDLCVRALADLPGPHPGEAAIVVHGVALKPGKPLCLGATRTRRGDPEGDEAIVGVAILPGFPTSALFTFHELVAPLLRELAGAGARPRERVHARIPLALHSERGRREYALVQLVADADPDAPPIALPLGKGSGSVTAFARADGFIAIDQQVERVDADAAVEVERIDAATEPVDLLIVGSHCTGLERIADRLHRAGIRVRLIAQGSGGGLQAAARGLCDVAPIHLCDERGVYNAPFVPEGCALVPGYGRMQGLLSRPGDRRFAPPGGAPAGGEFRLPDAVFDPAVIMVNRNRGSGTRVLIDRLLAAAAGDRRPRGYHHEARSHQGVAACVAQGRADWGVAIQSVAEGLAFAPILAERYDFVIPAARRQRPAVAAFLECLHDPELRAELASAGFLVDP
ncbi:MAG: molybdopterin biosynthesis protein [Myxococcales bacterium]|nr:molybdopterin biosynthesis protein [Myxococcales bacterium]